MYVQRKIPCENQFGRVFRRRLNQLIIIIKYDALNNVWNDSLMTFDRIEAMHVVSLNIDKWGRELREFFCFFSDHKINLFFFFSFESTSEKWEKKKLFILHLMSIEMILWKTSSIELIIIILIVDIRDFLLSLYERRRETFFSRFWQSQWYIIFSCISKIVSDTKKNTFFSL